MSENKYDDSFLTEIWIHFSSDREMTIMRDRDPVNPRLANTYASRFLTIPNAVVTGEEILTEEELSEAAEEARKNGGNVVPVYFSRQTELFLSVEQQDGFSQLGILVYPDSLSQAQVDESVRQEIKDLTNYLNGRVYSVDLDTSDNCLRETVESAHDIYADDEIQAAEYAAELLDLTQKEIDELKEHCEVWKAKNKQLNLGR